MIDYGGGMIFPDSWASGPPDPPEFDDEAERCLDFAIIEARESRSCARVLQTVVEREQKQNYTLDTLECGHTVADYDNRRPKRRRCPGEDGSNYSLRESS